MKKTGIVLKIAILLLCAVFPAVSFADYPVFVADEAVPGLYYWTGTNTPEEDLVSEEERKNIKQLVLPKDMPPYSMGTYNFQFTDLEAYIVEDSSPYMVSVDGVLFTKDMKVLVAYPRSRKPEEYIVPNGVTRIADNAFSGNAYLKAVTFSDSIVSIGESAFEDCGSLLKVHFSDALSCIGNRAFMNCQNLMAAEFPSSLKIIGYYAFRMSGLSQVSLNDGLLCIMSEAFYTHCFGDATVYLPESLLYLDPMAFSPDEKITILMKNNESLSVQGLYGVDKISIIADQ